MQNLNKVVMTVCQVTVTWLADSDVIDVDEAWTEAHHVEDEVRAGPISDAIPLGPASTTLEVES